MKSNPFGLGSGLRPEYPDAMEFPALNVSEKLWTVEDYELAYLAKGYLNTLSRSIYARFYHNQLFMDSRGVVYRLVGCRRPSAFVGFFYVRTFLLFEPTSQVVPFSKAQAHMRRMVQHLDIPQQYMLDDWLAHIESAGSIRELLVV